MGTIKIYTWGSDAVKEATVQEAKEIVKGVYHDPYGGIVVNRKTGKLVGDISAIDVDVDELYIIPDQPISAG